MQVPERQTSNNSLTRILLSFTSNALQMYFHEYRYEVVFISSSYLFIILLFQND